MSVGWQISKLNGVIPPVGDCKVVSVSKVTKPQRDIPPVGDCKTAAITGDVRKLELKEAAPPVGDCKASQLADTTAPTKRYTEPPRR